MDRIWSSYRRYQIGVPQSLWPDFFEQLSADHRGQLITLQRFDQQRLQLAKESLAGLGYQPLQSIIYQAPAAESNLVVTVSYPSGMAYDAIYAHHLGIPQWVRITTDEAGELLTCTVLDEAQTQTVIGFHPLSANKKREPKSPLSAV